MAEQDLRPQVSLNVTLDTAHACLWSQNVSQGTEMLILTKHSKGTKGSLVPTNSSPHFTKKSASAVQGRGQPPSASDWDRLGSQPHTWSPHPWPIYLEAWLPAGLIPPRQEHSPQATW